MEQQELILTREDADFDAVAALWAAHKIFPHALPRRPRRLREHVERFLALHAPSFPFPSEEGEPTSPRRIILVETHTLPHPFPPDTPVQVIDREPEERVAATTTLLVEELMRREIPLTRPEATLLALGIYEGSRMLLSPHTTPRDLRALAWLVEQGAEVAQAAEFLPPSTLLAPTRVEDIMSRHVHPLLAGMTIREGIRLAQQYGFEGFPVVDAEHRVLGIITRRELDRAARHGLADAPVTRFMYTGPYTVHPRNTFQRLEQVMKESGWGHIPVVDEEGGLLGIVTRTDVLHLWGRIPPPLTREEVIRRLQEALPGALLDLLHLVGREGAALDLPLYVVGGVVRDALLGVRNEDADVVVEGNAIELAKRLAARYGGRARVHPRFGTATWILPDTGLPFPREGLPPTLDLVSARTEFYEHPGALPTVERGSIKLDLRRRDFTINALAVRLDGEHWGELVDLFGGVRDLRAGRVRVLHPLSFVEDPTRILRAVRFEQRFRFRLDPRTEELLLDARAFLARVSSTRIAHELELILRERQPERALRRLHELGVFPYIHPDLPFDAAVEERFRRLREVLERREPPAPVDVVYWGLWLYDLPLEKGLHIADHLALRREVRRLLEDVARLRARVSHLTAPTVRPSEFVFQVERHSLAALFVLAVAEDHPRLWRRYDDYVRQWRHTRPTLDGHTLQREYGLPSGPELGTLLRDLRAAWLDGEIRSPQEEREYVERRLRGKADG